jgi:iron complex outermembrane receptor protein
MMSAAGIALASSPAFAQAGPQAEPEKKSAIDTIIVTADKRSEDLQDVAVAVTAYTSEQRDAVGIATIQDLTNFTPGLSYNTALDRVSIRGIGRNTNNLTADPGVATYVDGVYNAQTFNAAGDPLFTDRIEVLRGPEGTLYGRNSIGGAINSISKRPDKNFNAEVRTGLANYDRHFIEGTLTGPITDWLQYRVNGNWTEQKDGYFENVNGWKSEGGNIKSYYADVQLAAQLGERFDAWIKVSDRAYRTGTRSTASVGPIDTAPIVTGTSGLGPNYAYCDLGLPNSTPCTGGLPPLNVVTLPGAVPENVANSDLRKFQAVLPGNLQVKDNYTVTLEAAYHFDWADLKYIGGWQQYYLDIHSGFYNSGVQSYQYPCTTTGCTPLTFDFRVPYTWVEDKQFYSNEINLSSNGDGPLKWIVGAYQYREGYNQPVNYNLPYDSFMASTAVVLPYFESGAPQRSVDYYNTVANGTSYAGFGQIDWQATDQFKFTAGLRYTEDHKHGLEMTRQLYITPNTNGTVNIYNLTPGFAGTITPGGFGLVAAPPVSKGVGSVMLDTSTGIGYRAYDDKWNAVTGTAGVEWTPIQDTLIYAKYSRGYKSGGFNTGFLSGNAETDPEFVNAYEIGYKARPISTLQVNTAIYDYDYKNDQIPLSVSIVGSPAQTQFFNLPKVNNYGFEAEFVWAPVENITFNLGYDYAIAKIGDTQGFCFSDGADPHAVQPGANFAGCPIDPAPPATRSQSQNVKGAQLPQTPKNKVSFNMLWRTEFDAGTLTFSPSVIWKDKTYSSIFNRAYNLAPDYTQVDARLLWADRDNRYTVIAYVKNLFDKVGYDNVSAALRTNSYADINNPVLGENYSLTPPRTFGIEFQYRFK